MIPSLHQGTEWMVTRLVHCLAGCNAKVQAISRWMLEHCSEPAASQLTCTCSFAADFVQRPIRSFFCRRLMTRPQMSSPSVNCSPMHASSCRPTHPPVLSSSEQRLAAKLTSALQCMSDRALQYMLDRPRTSKAETVRDVPHQASVCPALLLHLCL